jgi:hypothetical protein
MIVDISRTVHRLVVPLTICIGVLLFFWSQNTNRSDFETPAALSNAVNEIALRLPRDPAKDEDITASISVGILPAGARISVTTDDGKIAGTIAPYGRIPGMKSGDHSIPIARSAVKKGIVTLHMEVLQRNRAPRAPLKSEVEGAKLVLVPVTREKSEVPQ